MHKPINDELTRARGPYVPAVAQSRPQPVTKFRLGDALLSQNDVLERVLGHLSLKDTLKLQQSSRPWFDAVNHSGIWRSHVKRLESKMPLDTFRGVVERRSERELLRDYSNAGSLTILLLFVGMPFTMRGIMCSASVLPKGWCGSQPTSAGAALLYTFGPMMGAMLACGIADLVLAARRRGGVTHLMKKLADEWRQECSTPATGKSAAGKDPSTEQLRHRVKLLALALNEGSEG